MLDLIVWLEDFFLLWHLGNRDVLATNNISCAHQDMLLFRRLLAVLTRFCCWERLVLLEVANLHVKTRSNTSPIQVVPNERSGLRCNESCYLAL